MYTILVDKLEARVNTEIMVTGVARAFGTEWEMPTMDDERRKFDAALCEEPKYIDPDQMALRQAIGLRL